MKKNTTPVQSISSTFLAWTIPAWWPWVFVLCGLDIFWFTHLDLVDGKLKELADTLIPGLELPGGEEITFLPFMLGVCCLLLLVFMMLASRRLPPPRTAVFPDRLELFDGKTLTSVYWKDIIVQDQGELDVWSETIGSGKGAYSVIRMDRREGERRVPLRLYYHFNPGGRIAPDYRNKSALKRAWLLAMLRARPELRVDLGIYAACKVSPANLRYSLRNTLMLWAGGVIALLTLVATGYALSDFLSLSSLSLWRFLAAIVISIAASILVLMLLDKMLGKYLFILPESPAVRAARRRLLGPATAGAPQASAYPLVDPDAFALSAMASVPTPRQQRCEKLIANPALPVDYPWDELDGDDWFLILDKRPDFAPHCRWHLLNGEAWALLLPEHPDWAEHCDWSIFETNDWAMLIASAPQFDKICLQHIGWDDFDGTDWAGLLASRPELLVHCNLQLLDADNWSYLLLFQPGLIRHCPTSILP